VQSSEPRGVTISDYAYNPRPRSFHPSLKAQIEAGAERYCGILSDALRFLPAFTAIAKDPNGRTSSSPYWVNGWIPALDGIALYGLVAHYAPALFVEVGSGNSTKFVRRAIEDQKLQTRIISIDPKPRADVDEICDEVIRSRLEDVDLGIFDQIRAGDMVFLDSSHRSFEGSDTTVFFTEILPDLPKGTIYGIHDIFLPFDYGVPTISPEWPSNLLPASWTEIRRRFSAFVKEFYNEQYLLASYLLGGGDGDEIILPCACVSSRPDLLSILNPIWTAPHFRGIEPWGGSFWLRRGSRTAGSVHP
jgi:hypothetical protein